MRAKLTQNTIQCCLYRERALQRVAFLIPRPLFLSHPMGSGTAEDIVWAYFPEQDIAVEMLELRPIRSVSLTPERWRLSPGR